jgi:hypothetical protein
MGKKITINHKISKVTLIRIYEMFLSNTLKTFLASDFRMNFGRWYSIKNDYLDILLRLNIIEKVKTISDHHTNLIGYRFKRKMGEE